LCGYPHKNQRGLELKIILSIENDEEPEKIEENKERKKNKPRPLRYVKGG